MLRVAQVRPTVCLDGSWFRPFQPDAEPRRPYRVITGLIFIEAVVSF